MDVIRDLRMPSTPFGENDRIPLDFNEDRDLEEAIQKNPRAPSFSFGNFSYVQYTNDCYKSSGWVLRKIVATTEAVRSVGFAMDPLLRAFFSFVWNPSKDDYKIHLYRCCRDLEASLGWIITLFNDRLGTFFIEDSGYHKRYYDLWEGNDLLVRKVKNPTNRQIDVINRVWSNFKGGIEYVQSLSSDEIIHIIKKFEIGSFRFKYLMMIKTLDFPSFPFQHLSFTQSRELLLRFNEWRDVPHPSFYENKGGCFRPFIDTVPVYSDEEIQREEVALFPIEQVYDILKEQILGSNYAYRFFSLLTDQEMCKVDLSLLEWDQIYGFTRLWFERESLREDYSEVFLCNFYRLGQNQLYDLVNLMPKEIIQSLDLKKMDKHKIKTLAKERVFLRALSLDQLNDLRSLGCRIQCSFLSDEQIQAIHPRWFKKEELKTLFDPSTNNGQRRLALFSEDEQQIIRGLMS